MSGVEAVFIDLDGTLVETRAANYAAYSQALSEAGVVVSRPDFDAMAHGRNWRQFLPELLKAGEAKPEQVARRKAELYPKVLALTVVNGALVRLLETMQCPIALVTTASKANAEAILRHHNLSKLFAAVVTGTDVARHKPAPDAYYLAAARLGVVPSRSLVIEDSDIGVASAQAFGAPVLRIRFGDDV